MKQEQFRFYSTLIACSLASGVLGGGLVYLLRDHLTLALFLLGLIVVNVLLAWLKWGRKKSLGKAEAMGDQLGQVERHWACFADVLERFVEESRLKPLDRQLLTNEWLDPQFRTAGWIDGDPTSRDIETEAQESKSRRDRAVMAIDLLAVRAAERQAKSQDGLTRALLIVAVVQALATIAQVVVVFSGR